MADTPFNHNNFEWNMSNRLLTSRLRTDTEDAECNSSHVTRSAAQSIDSYSTDNAHQAQVDDVAALAGAGAIFQNSGRHQARRLSTRSTGSRDTTNASGNDAAANETAGTAQEENNGSRIPKRRGSDVHDARSLQRHRRNPSDGSSHRSRLSSTNDGAVASRYQSHHMVAEDDKISESPPPMSDGTATPRSYASRDTREEGSVGNDERRSSRRSSTRDRRSPTPTS